MDREYYSDKTINLFIKKDICQNDSLLYKYYQTKDVKKFRRRLQILKVDHKKIEQSVYVYITDSIRYLILKFIGQLTKFMQPYGELIISGGEAFNTYFSQDDRMVTSDIDTKFIPVMKGNDGKLIGPSYYKYFGYLQIIKLILWNYLGQQCSLLSQKIKRRLETIKSKDITKLLGIHLPKTGPLVTRRYTLIRKHKQSANNSNKVTNGNVLIDVELFALDLNLKYFSVDKGKIEQQTLGGILDIAFMRPFEVGYEVLYSQQEGMVYKNPITNRPVFDKDIKIAGKKFLIDDLRLMTSLGLRPKKKEKDKKRVLRFSKKILKIKNIDSSTSLNKIFEKALSKVKKMEVSYNIHKRPKINISKLMKLGKQIDPYKYEKYTTIPDKKKVLSQFIYGLKGPRNIPVYGFKKTSGPFRFDPNKKSWKINKSSVYIKNEYNFRMNKKHINNKHNIKNLTNVVLYGYKPSRDYWLSSNIIKKSSLITFIGLKK